MFLKYFSFVCLYICSMENTFYELNPIRLLLYTLCKYQWCKKKMNKFASFKVATVFFWILALNIVVQVIEVIQKCCDWQCFKSVLQKLEATAFRFLTIRIDVIMSARPKKRGHPCSKEASVRIRLRKSVYQAWKEKKNHTGYARRSHSLAEFLLHGGAQVSPLKNTNRLKARGWMFNFCL